MSTGQLFLEFRSFMYAPCMEESAVCCAWQQPITASSLDSFKWKLKDVFSGSLSDDHHPALPKISWLWCRSDFTYLLTRLRCCLCSDDCWGGGAQTIDWTHVTLNANTVTW